MAQTLKKVSHVPSHIEDLLTKREIYRDQKQYKQADEIRQQIEDEGYILMDEDTVTNLYEASSNSTSRFLVLFGSGETSSTGRSIHECVLQQLNKPQVHIGVLTTPAGFQPNVLGVYQEVKEFFEEHLINFHPHVQIIQANTHEDANDPSIVNQLDQCDYIFTGAGSPTYALRVLHNSLLLQKIAERVEKGASLALSSAATLAFSAHCLPVYEIYKVGTELYWEEGLNFYEKYLQQKLTIIPHFDNNEGGAKNDTSRCYMGQERFAKLRELLPQGETVWGVDEHTGVVIDLDTQTHKVMGKGQLHLT